MNYVVGSGPTGVMAAEALLAAGAPVTMVDVGMECEPERLAVVRSLAAEEPEAWDAERLAQVRGPSKWDPIIPKLAFGSDFPYARNEMAALTQNGTHCLLSLARGGLSNVWGASVLPSRPEDLVDWPLSLDELLPHYAEVARRMPIAGARDGLEPYFPFHDEPLPAPAPSRQAERLLDQMNRNEGRLRANGIHFGRSRLALRTRADGPEKACRHCGLCLSGCPYGAIWNAADRVAALARRPGFVYRAGLLAERVESPPGGGVRLLCRSLGDGARVTLDGERAFLACGSLATANLVIDSLGAAGHPFALQYQPYFLLPLLAGHNVAAVADERLHTLAQIYLEIFDPSISRHVVHLQIYTYNPVIADRLDDATRWLPPARGLSRRLFLGRLLAIQGYLHSLEADPIRLVARPDAARGRSRLSLEAPDGKRVRGLVARVARKLAANGRALGALPLAPLVRVGDPGEGNHVGGVFPMRASPGEFETDRLGRLPALPRVHLVDASVLPNLAATTFTYTAMANAHRIATEALAEDARRGSA